MEYQIKRIRDFSEIDRCPRFFVDQYNWGGDYRPTTCGSLALLEGKGFYVKMTCQETDPVRTYTQPNDPVYLDSAMEAFFQFYPARRPDCYLNFEVNAYGALLAKYGDSRYSRSSFPDKLHRACLCRSTVCSDFWTMELLVPMELIEFVYGQSSFRSGDEITCNFYKIREQGEGMHFGSYTVIEHEEPNFHLTKYFARGILE